MYEIYGKTDIGMVRASNQDSLGWGQLPDGGAWVAVCDGMGGASGGNVASKLAVEIVSEYLNDMYNSDLGEEEIRKLLFSAVAEANVEIFEEACSNPELMGMGTTAVIGIIKSDVAHIVYVGDSRAYIADSQKAVQITRDHSVVQSLIDQGKLTAEQAKTDRRKSIITRAVGVDNSVQVDYCRYRLKEGQYLLLCSDGLSNYLDSDKMVQILFSGEKGDLTDRLIDEANKNGGGDNITVLTLCAGASE